MNKKNKITAIWQKQSGATLVEFVVAVPTILFTILGIMQTSMVFYAKSNLNYAAYEAARAGSVGNADLKTITDAFANAMAGYYGGGRTQAELNDAITRAKADINDSSLQIELLSPTKESFDDYYSPKLTAKYNRNQRVIPNSNISAIKCPVDRKNCNSDPTKNASGQTLSDANILNLRITYGIPVAKQMPLVGRFYVMALKGLKGIRGETSALTGLDNDVKTTPLNATTFEVGLLNDGRIPVVVHTTMRMQSDPIENGNISNPGPGNNGTPTPEGPENPDDGVIGSDTDGENLQPNPVDEDTISDCQDNSCCEALADEDIPADYLFDFDSAVLSQKGKAYLDQVIKKANSEEFKDEFTALTVTGHTDTIGSDAYNLDLSIRRANAVKDYLQNNGFPSGKPINASGRGEQEPVVTSCPTPSSPATEQDKACQSKNRRVTIKWQTN